MQSVTHVVKYVKYCLEIGLCCLLFFGLICLEACSKNRCILLHVEKEERNNFVHRESFVY